MNMSQQMWTIKEVSEKLGLSKSTLRYWEKEFEEIITPERTTGGQRRYAQQHFSILKEIHEQKKHGFSLSEIKRKLIVKQVKTEELNDSDVETLTERIVVAVRKELLHFLEERNKSN